MEFRRFILVTVIKMTIIHISIQSAQLITTNNYVMSIASDIHVNCTSDSIIVHISTEGNTNFYGLIYPKGLSKNSSCLQEYMGQATPVTYTLPLRSCNTMPLELDDGSIEYFNTIVVQPHLKLVTNQGKGFQVRCRYQAQDKIVSNNGTKTIQKQSLLMHVTTSMPSCSMKIYRGEPASHHIAENVNIGDPLTLVIAIEKQEIFGFQITDCIVRDGIGWSEQRLINHNGCPVDGEIMGQFIYNEDKTEGKVYFHAHKFPYTSSVYYQCNVSLCILNQGGCDNTPPICNELFRSRRDVKDENVKSQGFDIGTPAIIAVYSGFYVNEADVVPKANYYDVAKEKAYDDSDYICMTQRNFAIGIAIASIMLLLSLIGVTLIILSKKRQKSVSTPGSSIYSGPYTNTAYSHSS